MLEDLGDGEGAKRLPVVDETAGNVHAAHRAIEEVVGFDGAVFHGRGHGDDFEGRAGFVGRGDGAIHAGVVGSGGSFVGVEGGHVSHGEDFAGVGVLNNDGAGLGLSFVDGGGELFFGDVLNIFVDGESDADAGERGGFVAVDAAAAGVFGYEDVAGLAADLLVEGVFDAAEAAFVRIDVAEDVRSEGAAGINANGFFLDVDASKV